MNYEVFVDRFKEKVKEYMYPYTVTLEETILNKVNQQVKGLTVSVEGYPVAPVFHLEELYKENQDGHTVAELAYKASLDANEVIKHTLELWGEKEDITPDNLYAAVVNTDKNREMLKQVPHREYKEMSVIPRYRLTNNTSFLVNKDICKQFYMTQEEVLETAIRNTHEMGYTVKRLDDVLKENIDGLNMEENSCAHVVSNIYRTNGAAAILDTSWMEHHAEEIGGSFYIIPSSIHELLTIPENVPLSVSDIQTMVETVNRTCVDERDFLSNNVYHYNAKTKSVSQLTGKTKEAVASRVAKQAVNARNR